MEILTIRTSHLLQVTINANIEVNAVAVIRSKETISKDSTVEFGFLSNLTLTTIDNTLFLGGFVVHSLGTRIFLKFAIQTFQIIATIIRVCYAATVRSLTACLYQKPEFKPRLIDVKTVP